MKILKTKAQKFLEKIKLNYVLLFLILIIFIQTFINIHLFKKFNSIIKLNTTTNTATEKRIKQFEGKLNAMYSQLYRVRNYQFDRIKDK